MIARHAHVALVAYIVIPGALVRLLILSGFERNPAIEEVVPEDKQEEFRCVLDTTLWGRGVVNPVADGKRSWLRVEPQEGGENRTEWSKKLEPI